VDFFSFISLSILASGSIEVTLSRHASHIQLQHDM
jgi:hypothetical protein